MERNKRLSRHDWDKPPRLSGCHFGGGGSGGTQVSKFEPPDYTKQPWQDYLSGVAQLSQKPYEQYNGQQIAEINPTQWAAGDLVTQRALYGAPDLNAARGAATDVASGAYMNSPGLNSNVQPSLNPYFGPNPYLSSMVSSSANDMANAFATGTAANTDAMMARSGNFGGSQHQLTQQGNAAGLAKSIGDMANSAYMQDYNAQMGLGENAVNRQLQAQQFNVGQQQGAYNAGVGQMLQGAQLGGQLSQDDYASAQNLMGWGDAQRGYTQDMLNANKADWTSAQTYPYMQADLMANALARASGGMGTNTATTSTSNQASPFAALLGGGLAAYGLLK